jgi:hypothetical protein
MHRGLGPAACAPAPGPDMRNRLFRRLLMMACGVMILGSGRAAAQDRLCDPGDEDCRAIPISYIRNETVGIDVATAMLGPLVYFAFTGPQTIRVQTREDGFSIDQIVLSHTTFASTSPDALTHPGAHQLTHRSLQGVSQGDHILRTVAPRAHHVEQVIDDDLCGDVQQDKVSLHDSVLEAHRSHGG